MIAQGHSFLVPGLGEIRTESSPMGMPNAGGVGIGADFLGPKLLRPSNIYPLPWAYTVYGPPINDRNFGSSFL